MIKKLLIISIILIVLSYFEVNKWAEEKGPLEASKIVYIPKGQSLKQIAYTLKDEKVISHPLIFVLKARLGGLDGQLKAGEYEFGSYIALNDVLQKIAKGEFYYHKFMIPEGLTTGQILYMIENNPDLSGEINIDINEGELLPETYSFVKGMDKNKLLLLMKNNMDKVLDEAWQNRQPNLHIKNKQQALILASIIEKETGMDNERALVASVFLNRLKKGMRLQTDPSVIYAITNGEFNFGRPITKADLNYDSKYNTYRYAGLTPGPICNPGQKSINAALNPVDSDYIYFVADGKGGHNFAKSLNEHNNNVRNWRSNK